MTGPATILRSDVLVIGGGMAACAISGGSARCWARAPRSPRGAMRSASRKPDSAAVAGNGPGRTSDRPECLVDRPGTSDQAGAA